MGKRLALVKWLSRAWPVWAMCAVLAAHLLLVRAFPSSATEINASAALISQLVGGLLVLHSLNSAIGLVKKGSLFSLFLQYLKEFPLFRRPQVAYMQGISSASMSGTAEASVTRKPKTIEEQIAYLQEQLGDLRRDTQEGLRKANAKIDLLAQETSAKIEETSQDLRKLRETFEESTTSGVTEQIFGALLVIYGSIAAYVT